MAPFVFCELQLKVIQLGCAEINANNGAFVQALVAFEAIPPQVGFLHTKADRGGGPSTSMGMPLPTGGGIAISGDQKLKKERWSWRLM